MHNRLLGWPVTVKENIRKANSSRCDLLSKISERSSNLKMKM